MFFSVPLNNFSYFTQFEYHFTYRKKLAKFKKYEEF